MIPNCRVSTIGQWTRTPIAEASNIIGISTEIPCRDSTKLKFLLNVRKKP